MIPGPRFYTKITGSATFAAGQTATFIIPVQVDTGGLEVLSMESSAAGAGVSNSAPILVNASDPISPQLALAHLAKTSVNTSSRPIVQNPESTTTTCSTTTTTTTTVGVPEFGWSATLVAGTVLVAVILLRRWPLGSGNPSSARKPGLCVKG